MRHPVMFLGGNHEYWPALRGVERPTEIRPGLTFLPNGTVFPDLDGKRVGILGGADSVRDAAIRRLDLDWWPEDERVSRGAVELLLYRARKIGGLDLLLTHTPPASVTMAMLGIDDPGPSAILVEETWQKLGCPPIVSGHMHMPFRLGNVEVLPELGVTAR